MPEATKETDPFLGLQNAFNELGGVFNRMCGTLRRESDYEKAQVIVFREHGKAFGGVLQKLNDAHEKWKMDMFMRVMNPLPEKK